jgi:hypothetical protein
MQSQKVEILIVIGTFALSQTTMLGTAFGDAVPLIPTNTGDSILNKQLSEFYDCIANAIVNSPEGSTIRVALILDCSANPQMIELPEEFRQLLEPFCGIAAVNQMGVCS